MNPKRTLFAPEHELYRDMVARFIAERITPHHEQWEHEGMVPRELWRQAGQAGLLLPSTPESYGGGGGDFPHTLAVVEIARALATGVTGFTTHSDIVAPYLLNFGTEDQKLRHLPAMARGDTVASLAITEPGAGSDVKAIRSTAARVDGGYLLNGQKTFITNGFHADRVLVAAKTDPAAGARGISLFWWTRPRRASRAAGCWTGRPARPGHRRAVLPGRAGARRGPAGRAGAGLWLHDEGAGARTADDRRALRHGAGKRAAMDGGLRQAAPGVRQGAARQPVHPLQAGRYQDAGRRHPRIRRRLRAPVPGRRAGRGRRGMAKLWAAEATRAIDDLLQFHGGYGCMREYPIGRAYTDVRPNRIYGAPRRSCAS